MPRALVLGAGIQGVCVSLVLLRRGYDVTLIDQAEDCLRRTSLRNEGKMHLGFLFANDPTLRTAELMMRGAIAFAPLIERWFGEPGPWDELCTRPFAYCLARNSMLSADTLLSHYTAVEARFLDAMRDPTATYLGQRPSRIWRRMDRERDIPELSRSYAEPFVQTVEVAIDRPGFSDWVRRRLHGRPRLRTQYGHRIDAVERTSFGFRAGGTRLDGEPWRADADVVVNCLWQGRLAIDRTIGLAPKRDWVHRLKYRVFVRAPAALSRLPPMTFVLGPYGDIVTYPDGLTYLSYYPLSIQGWSSDLEPPREWDAACDGKPDPCVGRDLATRVIDKLDEVLPGLRESTVAHVDAGAIFTWGKTDIDDPESELHDRFDVGIEAADGYFSVDTGKYTTAPLFADQLERML